MADREKVMKALKCRVTDPVVECGNCPYNDATDDWRQRCDFHRLCADALALLREQEPRVMPLDEVRNLKYDDVVYYQGINTNSVESAIVLHGEKMVPEVNTRVVQFRHADGTGGWNGINNADLNGYGKKWRCWTSRPTREQMRDTPWEGENETM
jgi:hypothetical protein